MSQSHSVLLKGNVTITISNKKTGEKKVIKLDNAIAEEFALAMTLNLLGGVAQGYARVFGTPSGIAFIFQNGATTVTQISATLNSFSDTLASNAETTTATFYGSDASPSTYTITAIQLWTIVGGVLFLRVAYFYLPEPLTKNTDDIITISWTESVVTQVPLANWYTFAQSQCNSQCSSPSACLSFLQSIQGAGVNGNGASIVNLLWALLLIPNFQSTASKFSTPLTQLVSTINGTITGFVGLAEVFLINLCSGQSQLQVAVGLNTEVVVGANNIYGAVNFTFNNNVNPNFALVVVTFSTSTGGYNAVLGFIPITGSPITGTNQVGILLRVPYGLLTQQSQQVSS